MKIETQISKDIEAADNVNAGNSKKTAATAYDAAVKKLLSNKPFLAWIMKGCIPEYNACTLDEIATKYIEGTPLYGVVRVDEDETKPSLERGVELLENPKNTRIEGRNNESNTMLEGATTFDIRFDALLPKSDSIVRVIVNVEAQNDSSVPYPILKRAIYYCSRMISAQKGTNFAKSDYGKLKKVYSIWVMANPEEGMDNTIMTYNITEQAVKGSAVDLNRDYDMISVTLIRLNDLPIDSDKKLVVEKLEPDVIGMLTVLLKGQLSAEQRKQVLEEKYDIEMSEDVEKEVSEMCNLSKGILEQGAEQGAENRSREVALKMLADNMPLDMIVKYTELSKEYIEKLKKTVVATHVETTH